MAWLASRQPLSRPGELNAPEVTEDTVAAVEEAERTFLDDLKDWFAETFDVSGLGDYVPDAAMDAMSTLMEYENMALGALGWIRSAVSSDLKVLLPEVLASKLAAPSELAQGILMCINKAQVIGELADFKVPRIESENMNGEIRQRTNTNAYALEKLVAGAVVSRQIQEVAQLVPAAVEEAQAAIHLLARPASRRLPGRLTRTRFLRLTMRLRPERKLSSWSTRCSLTKSLVKSQETLC